MNFSSEEIGRRLSSNEVKYLIASYNRGAIGFADFEIIGKSCKLMGVAVIDEYRRKGVAKQLLQRVLQEATNAKCERIFLLVAEDNLSAVALYRQFGFIQKGKSDKILDGKPIIIMDKLLATHLNLAG